MSAATRAGRLRWPFGDQLGPHFRDRPEQPVLLIESRAVFARRRFHRAKAHLVLSAMRHRAADTAGYWWFLRRNADRLAGTDRMRKPLSGLRRLADLDAVVGQERRRGSDPP